MSLRPVLAALLGLFLAVLATACGGGGGSSPDGGGGVIDASGGGPDAGAGGGVMKWSLTHKLAVAFAPAIAADGTIIVHGQPDFTVNPADMAPSVLAISPDGKTVWTGVADVGAIDAPPATIIGDTVYIPSTDPGADTSTLHRFALSDGTPGPTDTMNGVAIYALGVAADGTFYVPAAGVSAIGTSPWSFPLDSGGVTGSNVAVGPSGTLYVGARGQVNHNLYAINPNGTEKWHRDLGAAVISPLAIGSDERIYVVDGDGLLSVYEATGDLAWSWQAPSFNPGGGIVLGPDGTVYLGTLAGTPADFADDWMFAVKQGVGTAGEQVWRANVDHMVTTTPALSAGGTLYVSDACRGVHALDAKTGAKKWTFNEPHTPAGMCADFSAPALAADGTVYVSTEGPAGDTPMGGLYALTGDGTGPAASAWPVESGNPAHTGRVE